MSRDPDMTPDAFAVAAHTRRLRTRRRRIRFAVVVTVLALAGCLLVVLAQPDLWEWALFGFLLVAVTATLPAHVDGRTPVRPRPDTPVEIGQVLGCEVDTWGGTAAGQFHRIRVFLQPCGGPGTLLWADILKPADEVCDLPTGTVLAFRRHPTMRHMVWLAEDPPDDSATAIVFAADRAATLRRLTEGTRDTARIAGVTVGDTGEDGRYRVDAVLALPDGTTGRTACLLLPEQLGCVAPGTEFEVYRVGSDCALVFPSARVRRA